MTLNITKIQKQANHQKQKLNKHYIELQKAKREKWEAEKKASRKKNRVPRKFPLLVLSNKVETLKAHIDCRKGYKRFIVTYPETNSLISGEDLYEEDHETLIEKAIQKKAVEVTLDFFSKDKSKTYSDTPDFTNKDRSWVSDLRNRGQIVISGGVVVMRVE